MAGLGVVLIIIYSVWHMSATRSVSSFATTTNAVAEQSPVSTAPVTITLSGTYVCLPTQNGVVTADCAFGIQSDDGDFYAVNFGAGAGSMADFTNGAHITARGTVVLRENLHPDSWTKFTIKGLFTVFEKL